MRALNRNERLLAGLFGGLAFLFLNLAGMRWIANHTATAKADIAQLESDAAAARVLLKDRPGWVVRQNWVESHPPEAYDEKTSRSKFVQDVQSGVAAQQLKIESQQPLEPEREGRLVEVGIEITVTGRLESIVRWLYDLQQPGKYERIRTFTLKQAEDGNTMQALVRLGKVFRTGDVAANP